MDDAGRVVEWHSLVDHMTVVAACFVVLSACQCLRRAMERAAGRALDKSDIARLAVLVFLHDLGKANSGFQAKRWPRGAIPKGWPDHAGHGAEAIRLFEDEPFLQPLVDLLPVDELCTWGDTVDGLLKASISHHGRPIVDPIGDWNRSIWPAPKPSCFRMTGAFPAT